MDQSPVARPGLVLDREGAGIGAFRGHHGDHRKPVFSGELEVALVVGGAAEDRARSIVHEHEICHEDGERAFGDEGVDGLDAGVEPFLLGALDGLLAGAQPVAFGDESAEFRVVCGQGLGERVVGGNRAEACAEDGVVPGGVDVEGLVLRHSRPFEREDHVQAFGAPDPVLLHQAHLLGPALELFETLQELELFRESLRSCSLEALRREYALLFSLTVGGGIAMNEIEYVDTHGFNKTQLLADISGFYQAFGMQVAAGERVDFVGVEMEFMHWLLTKERYALDRNEESNVQVCRDATRAFLKEHAGCWVPSVGRRLLQETRLDFYRNVGQALVDFLDSECQRLEVEPAVMALTPSAPGPITDEHECPCGL